MSTGIILGLGLITIVLCFYIMLNIPYWLKLWEKTKNESIELKKEYYQWVYKSDDSLNKILKFCVFCLYVCSVCFALFCYARLLFCADTLCVRVV